jgi:hypothetical protein
VKGDLNGEEAVLLEEGARVVGDVRAPRVAIAPGALVRGYVDTGNGTSSAPAAQARAARAQPAAQRHAPPAPARAAVPAHRPVAATPVVHALAGTRALPAAEKPARRPPPPVVPVLKKAKGQMAKKKER